MTDSLEVEPPIPLVLLPCTTCNRTFRPEALPKHTKVCEKMLMKKRKKFDSAKQRLHGTDVPSFPPPPKQKESPLKPIQQSSKWREKQVELTKTLNSMRKKSDGNLLVKPSDHEQCPYCERFFGPKAYDRHTEWCKEQHIKLKNNSNVNNEARERLQVRTKYRAPLSNRVLTRDKYLPRSRDPSPMSLPKVEADETVKQKTSSPLNRTSSLRMSGRSKTMITKSPSFSPDSKDIKPRTNLSSTTVRTKSEKEFKAPGKEQLTINSEHTKPKILTSSHNPKKIGEQVKEKDRLTLRKCKSWTESIEEEDEEKEKVEELKVYACVLHPLSEKRSFESSLSQANGRKRSLSVSKSFETLPRTYIIGKAIAENPHTKEEVQDEVADKPNCTCPERSNDCSEDQTSEMVSDNIYQHGDADNSWKLLPATHAGLDGRTKQDGPKPIAPLLAIEYLPAIITAENNEYMPEKEVDDGRKDSLKTDSARGMPLSSGDWSDFLKNEYPEVRNCDQDHAASDFLNWCANNHCMDGRAYAKQPDASEASFSFEDTHNSFLNEFQAYLEKSGASDAHDTFDHCYYSPPKHYSHVQEIVEIKDASTTVDDFLDYLAENYSDNVSSSFSQVKDKAVQTIYRECTSSEVESDGSSRTNVISTSQFSDLKQAKSDSCLLKSSAEFGAEHVFIVGSNGSLSSLRKSEPEDELGLLENPNRLAKTPDCQKNIIDVDSGLCTSEDRFPKDDEPKESHGEEFLAGYDILKMPYLNDMIGYLIGAKPNPNLTNLINVATINNLSSFVNHRNNVEENTDRPKTAVLRCHELVQVDFPCLQCEERELEVATKLMNCMTEASCQTLAMNDLKEDVRDLPNPEFNPNSKAYPDVQIPNHRECYTIEESSDSAPTESSPCLNNEDDTSEWDISESNCSLCSQDSELYRNESRNFMRKRTVKYYETVEYRETKEGASTIKTTIKQLPPLKNPPKYIIAKTIKKEIQPLSPERRQSKRENCYTKDTGECLKLPPIKRRFERHPCLTRAAGDGDAIPTEPSKFCHECGTKYPVPKAKFCCNCGIRRLAV